MPWSPAVAHTVGCAEGAGASVPVRRALHDNVLPVLRLVVCDRPAFTMDTPATERINGSTEPLHAAAYR
jgi:hypothetical protein